MEIFKLNANQLVLWNNKAGFERGIIVGIGLAADELTTLVVIQDSDGNELQRIAKQPTKWKKVPQ